VDLAAAVFLFCFAFGAAFTLVSFIGGHAVRALGAHGFDHGHVGHHGAQTPSAANGHLSNVAHTHGGPGTASHVEPGRERLPLSHSSGLLFWVGSLLSPSTASMCLTWFGGVGYACYAVLGLPLVVSLVFAVIGGVAGAATVTAFLVGVLMRGETLMDESQVLAAGTLARVSRDIRADGTGEIVFTLGETRHSEGARSADGEEIPRGTEVVVARVERGIAYVVPWSAYTRAPEQKESVG
jgi:hypothetical protein